MLIFDYQSIVLAGPSVRKRVGSVLAELRAPLHVGRMRTFRARAKCSLPRPGIEPGTFRSSV